MADLRIPSEVVDLSQVQGFLLLNFFPFLFFLNKSKSSGPDGKFGDVSLLLGLWFELSKWKKKINKSHSPRAQLREGL